MNGYGEFIWKDGKKYIGFYVDDKKEGFGIHYWPSPQRIYIGFWKGGKQEGIGKFIKLNDIKYGEWVNGERLRFFDNFLEASKAIPQNHLKFMPYFNQEMEKINELLNSAVNS
jgi:hypothetical protein